MPVLYEWRCMVMDVMMWDGMGWDECGMNVWWICVWWMWWTQASWRLLFYNVCTQHNTPHHNLNLWLSKDSHVSQSLYWRNGRLPKNMPLKNLLLMLKRRRYVIVESHTKQPHLQVQDADYRNVKSSNMHTFKTNIWGHFKTFFFIVFGGYYLDGLLLLELRACSPHTTLFFSVLVFRFFKLKLYYY